MFYDALYIYFHHTYALCTNEKMEEKNHLEMERMLPATLVFFHLYLFFCLFINNSSNTNIHLNERAVKLYIK